MATVRTFIAAEVSAEVRAGVHRLIDELSQSGATVKWVDEEDIHLTIKFLGEVEYVVLNDVCRAVAAAIQDFEPFSVTCASVGAFPSLARPRTLWLGIDSEQEILTTISAAVEDAMADLGFRRESRPFHPHLTIGRVRDGRQLGDFPTILESGDFSVSGSFTVDELVIFSSELTAGGPIYTPMGRAALGV